jgi:hypothetical protein
MKDQLFAKIMLLIILFWYFGGCTALIVHGILT